MRELTVIAEPRCLAIVPARGGSKGLHRKNLAEIAGEPLIARAIRTAHQCGRFARIVASTDDPQIAEVARACGADVPLLRPAELASDTSNIRDAVTHLLEVVADQGDAPYDMVVLLEPTSPARTPIIVADTIAAAATAGFDAAFTVSSVPTRYHALKQFCIGGGGVAENIHPAGAKVVNRQELMPTFIRNGMCYAVRTTALASGASLTGSAAKLVVVEGPVINIDDLADLEIARQVLEK